MEENTMKKSRLLGTLCACLFAFSMSTSTHAAFLVGEDTSGNEVINTGNGAGAIDVEINFNNLEPVWLFFDPVFAGGSENMTFSINNLTDYAWTDFHIEFEYSNLEAPVPFNFPIIAPSTDPIFNADIGLNDITGLPDSVWIFFNTPELYGLYVTAIANTSADPLAKFSIHLQPTVVPVPAAVWLFGSGLLGLVGIARRKKV